MIKKFLIALLLSHSLTQANLDLSFLNSEILLHGVVIGAGIKLLTKAMYKANKPKHCNTQTQKKELRNEIKNTATKYGILFCVLSSLYPFMKRKQFECDNFIELAKDIFCKFGFGLFTWSGITVAVD